MINLFYCSMLFCFASTLARPIITTTTQELLSYCHLPSYANLFPHPATSTVLSLMHIAPKYLKAPQSLNKEEQAFAKRFNILTPFPPHCRFSECQISDPRVEKEPHPYKLIAVEGKTIYAIFNPELGKNYPSRVIDCYPSGMFDEVVAPCNFCRGNTYIDPRTTDEKGYYNAEMKWRRIVHLKDFGDITYSGLMRKTFYNYSSELWSIKYLIEDLIHRKEVSGEYHFQNDVNTVKIVFAGCGLSAGFSEILALRMKGSSSHWNLEVLSFNSPYVLGKDNLPQFFEIINTPSIWANNTKKQNLYWPMTLNTDSGLCFPDYKSKRWLTRQGLGIADPVGTINISNWSSSWGAGLSYPPNTVFDFLPPKYKFAPWRWYLSQSPNFM